MGKRQFRIFRKDLLSRRFELLQSPAVQVVLRSKVVLAGKLKELDEKGAELQDLRFNYHTFRLEQVEEMIYDVEAPY
ncbi:hypothetical protein [Pontibacter chinhatensis]|uniref:Uncharacterized protein n=1 Tax=Pontibacter chinhatensis TaxID=1436961 RepID=A0A1I2RNB5_9BACT|nr:hypothetical protein [Pontibacter chinhatensis]SFG42012.1 hypothetical protein SAMN05421739_102461 [Pontibacter chinhatensis]